MRFVLFLLLCLFSIFSVKAEEIVSYMDEVKALGAVSGQGLACGASRYDTFEMIARVILVTKARSNAEQAAGMKAYNNEKANAYVSKQLDGFYECAQIVRQFDNQDIFNDKIYADGTIQMPDGAMYTPRAPYDVMAVYKTDEKQKEHAQKIYDRGGKRKISNLRVNTGAQIDGSTPPVYKGSSSPLIRHIRSSY